MAEGGCPGDTVELSGTQIDLVQATAVQRRLLESVALSSYNVLANCTAPLVGFRVRDVSKNGDLVNVFSYFSQHAATGPA